MKVVVETPRQVECKLYANERINVVHRDICVADDWISDRNFVIFVCCAHRIFFYDFVVVCRSLIMKSIE